MVGVGLGRNFERNRPPRWTAPVPEMVCREAACKREREEVRISVSRRDVATYTAFFYGGGVRTQDELLGSGGEFSKTSDGQVFVVEIGILTEDVVGLDRVSE
jgi:hypothetical protein